MFGKLNTRVLLITVAALALLWWLGGRIGTASQERSFREVLVSTDTTRVDSFTIVPAKWKRIGPLRFKRSGGGWTVTAEGKTVRTDSTLVRELLGDAREVRTIRIAGEFSEAKDRFELGDSTADRLVMGRGGSGAELLVGKGSVTDEAFTYACVPDEKEIYAVHGTLGTLTDYTVLDWMPKYLATGDPRNWRRLTYTFPTDTGYAMENNHGNWSIEGELCDQMRVLDYLASVAHARGHAITDPADTVGAARAFKLVIDDSTRTEPMVIEVLAKIDHYLVRSSVSPGVVMPFDNAKELPRMFRPRGVFLPRPPQVQRMPVPPPR